MTEPSSNLPTSGLSQAERVQQLTATTRQLNDRVTRVSTQIEERKNRYEATKKTCEEQYGATTVQELKEKYDSAVASNTKKIDEWEQATIRTRESLERVEEIINPKNDV